MRKIEKLVEKNLTSRIVTQCMKNNLYKKKKQQITQLKNSKKK